MKTIIYNGTIVTNGESFLGSIIIDNSIIIEIIKNDVDIDKYKDKYNVIDACGMYVLPGIIDDQVHFREPGSTHKGDIESESAAAVLGGVTSFMDMPNNNPPATTLDAIERKFNIAANTSYANYSFYIGATNDNIEQIIDANNSDVCGVKVFMGSSTGNMLVDNNQTLDAIFKNSNKLIATHCESEEIINKNLQLILEKYSKEGKTTNDIPFSTHPIIRDRESCIESSKKAIEFAKKHNSRLHILHISTKEEIELIAREKEYLPNLTAEACVHFLYFNSNDYHKYGSKIKCNPAIKEQTDRSAILQGINDNTIDIIATDHAPHTIEEKNKPYLEAPSGLPLVQHSLIMMFELFKKGEISIENIVQKMCHAPAEVFKIEKRGYLKEGYFADITIIDPNKKQVISKDNLKYRCNWSPLEGYSFSSSVVHTIINGTHIVENGQLTGKKCVQKLSFSK